MSTLKGLAPLGKDFKAASHFLSSPMASMVVDGKSVSFNLHPVWIVMTSFIKKKFLEAVSMHVSGWASQLVLFEFTQFLNMHNYALYPTVFIFLHGITFSLDLEHFIFLVNNIGNQFCLMMFLLKSYSADYTTSTWFQSFPVISSGQSDTQKKNKWYTTLYS